MNARQKARELIQEELSQVFNKQDFIRILTLTNGRVPGFTKSNLHKVPDSLLKKYANQQLNKISNTELFLKDYVKFSKEKFSDTSLNEFIMELNMDLKMTEAEKIILFFLNYPKQFESKRKIIKENIKEKKPAFHNLINHSLEEQLEFIEKTKTNLSDYFPSIWRYHPNIKSLNDHVLNKSLEENVNALRSYHEDGFYLKAYEESIQDWSKWDDKTQNKFFRLVIHDAISFCHFIIQEFESLQSTMQELEANYEQETNKINSLYNEKIKDLESLEKANTDLKIRLNELEGKYNELKEEKKLHEKENQQTKEKLENKKIELEKMLEKQTTILDKKETKHLLFEDENIHLFTQVQNNIFDSYFTEKQITYFTNIQEVDKLLTKLDKNLVFFISIDGISTKESFYLEQPFKDKNMIYKIVSGGPIKIIREIIFYLEGELRYEIKTENKS